MKTDSDLNKATVSKLSQPCEACTPSNEALRLAKYVHHPVKHFSIYDSSEQNGATLPLQSKVLHSSQPCEACTPSNETFLQL